MHRMDTIMKTVVKDIEFFINTEVDHHLPVTQFLSFLEQTQVGSEQSVVEYCTALHEEHL
jgi:hypothetical protein